MTALSASLLGKAPFEADFLRVNVAHPGAPALHRWLEAGSEGLGGADVPPFCFALAVPGGFLVGAVGPSSDRIGRAFPLAAFAPLEPVPSSAQAALVPHACAQFFEAASALVARAAAGASEGLAEGVAELPPVAVRAEGEQALRLSEHTLAELEALFPDGAHWYALNTAVLACGPKTSGVVLDCPLSASVGADFWLELVARRRAGKPAPSFLWNGERALISLGEPAPSWMVVSLARPDHVPSRQWPLRTSQPAAVATARGALSALPALSDSSSPLQSVLQALEGLS
jgi:type VI secretion system ImpM family protein